MQQTQTGAGYVPRSGVHVRTASSTTGVTAAVGAVYRVSKATGMRGTSLLLQAVLEESKALGKSKALKEARSEEELATAKSESRPDCAHHEDSHVWELPGSSCKVTPCCGNFHGTYAFWLQKSPRLWRARVASIGARGRTEAVRSLHAGSWCTSSASAR